jgi:hypothetical protein
MSNNLIVKSRGGNMFDVFFGREGWEDWACFLRQRNRLLLIKGSPVPNAVYTAISQQILGNSK